MDLGNIYKEARKQSGLSQQKAADKLGVTIPTINSIEKNKGNVSIKTYKAYADLLGYEILLLPK